MQKITKLYIKPKNKELANDVLNKSVYSGKNYITNRKIA